MSRQTTLPVTSNGPQEMLCKQRGCKSQLHSDCHNVAERALNWRLLERSHMLFYALNWTEFSTDSSGIVQQSWPTGGQHVPHGDARSCQAYCSFSACLPVHLSARETACNRAEWTSFQVSGQILNLLLSITGYHGRDATGEGKEAASLRKTAQSKGPSSRLKHKLRAAVEAETG